MSTVTTPASVDRELAALVGEGNVARTDFEGFNINGVLPAAVVSPGSAEEVGAVLGLANERELVVAPAGGLTKQQIGGVPERIDILLSTTRLNKVE
ncbi:MAG TPA: FAD-binding protein, partial [Alphaproteobacteria bacterium]|nr:FAD-binding protein [Alphaproteobacteria bacterium]